MAVLSGLSGAATSLSISAAFVCMYDPGAFTIGPGIPVDPAVRQSQRMMVLVLKWSQSQPQINLHAEMSPPRSPSRQLDTVYSERNASSRKIIPRLSQGWNHQMSWGPEHVGRLS
ncbi:hypothetical protein FOQG_10593 [Fusarium oxysporum f. sp. raphani 54005]|uniref:Uncharacterized protein n=1 Tax=Fusarium oxysporum f. sp. raphani 54005 TaxID=1089458 RepID=X0BUE2_FUSOX|nr:hypothetical protein FOQG_10593 [Fusarium oxysporum f. sp. raphani 54005]